VGEMGKVPNSGMDSVGQKGSAYDTWVMKDLESCICYVLLLSLPSCIYIFLHLSRAAVVITYSLIFVWKDTLG